MYENNPKAFHPKLDALFDRMLAGGDKEKKHTTSLFYKVGKLHPEVSYFNSMDCLLMKIL